jgi:chromosome segregation ATPase
MLISRDLYRLCQGKIRKPVGSRHQGPGKSAPVPRASLVLDRPQTEREFLEEMTEFIDEQITVISDPVHVFHVHQAAFERVIAKFPAQSAQLKCVKTHYEKLITSLQSDWETFSAWRNQKEKTSVSSEQIIERHEKTQKKRAELNDAIQLLHSIIPDLRDETMCLRETLNRTRQEVNDKTTLGRNLQVSVADFKDFSEMLGHKRTRKREKAAHLEDELTRIRATFEAAKKLMTDQLNRSWEMKATVARIRQSITFMHTKELDPVHVQQMNVKVMCQRREADVESIKRETREIEDEIAKIKALIAMEVAQARAKHAAQHRPTLALDNLIALSYYNRRLHVLSI